MESRFLHFLLLPSEWSTGQQVIDIGAIEFCGAGGGGGHDGVVEGGFAFFEGHHFFFDGVAHEEAVDEDGVFLADAVGAVGGLVFDGGVPPGVEVEDVGGSGEIEAGAAGFEGDEEDGGAETALELLDEVFSFRDGGGAVEPEVGDFGFGEVGLEGVEGGGELGEDEGGLAGGCELLELRGEVGELWGYGGFGRACEAGGDAGLAELHEGG